MNQNRKVCLVQDDGKPVVVLRIGTEKYLINHVELVQHDSKKATHEYRAMINGSLGYLLVNCGLTPPMITILGTIKHAIDHSFQDLVIGYLDRTIKLSTTESIASEQNDFPELAEC